MPHILIGIRLSLTFLLLARNQPTTPERHKIDTDHIKSIRVVGGISALVKAEDQTIFAPLPSSTLLLKNVPPTGLRPPTHRESLLVRTYRLTLPPELANLIWA